jgi:hypothetical protein
MEENFHTPSRSMECQMIYSEGGKVDRMERPINSGEKKDLEISLVKCTTATERKIQQKIEWMKREQEISKMTGETGADENQALGGIGTIKA